MKVFIFFFLFLPSLLFSQNIKLHKSLNEVESIESSNIIVENIDEGYLIVNWVSSSNNPSIGYSTLFLLDQDLNITHSVKKIEVFGVKNSIVLKASKNGKGNLLLVKFTKESNVFIATIQSDKKFENLNIVAVDTIGTKDLYVFDFNKKENGNIFTAGTLIEELGDSISDNYYIEYDNNGNFIKRQKFKFKYSVQNEYVTEVNYLEDSDEFFFSTFLRNSYLLSSNFETLNKIINTADYTWGNIQNNGFRFLLQNCKQINLGLFSCFSRGLGRDDYGISKLEIDIKDTIGVQNLTPKFDNLKEERLFGLKVVNDTTGNSIVVATGEMDYYLSYTTPNNLYIQKYDENTDLIWGYTYDSGDQLLVRDVVTNENGDIIIVGNYWTGELKGNSKDFYMKINSDGTVGVSSIPLKRIVDVKVYPNPFLNNVYVDFPSVKAEINYRVLGFDGKIYQKGEFNSNKQNELDLSHLPNGVYVLKMVIGDEVVSRKIIKN